jgi:RNA polymerase sigma factor (sigma-70 family)
MSVTDCSAETLAGMNTLASTERQRFEELVVRHQQAVCATAFAVVRNQARSEEIAQEAFLIAWRRLECAPGVVTAAWICGVARNLARNAVRRRTEVMMEVDRAAVMQDTRDALIEREDASRVEALLAELPERYREAVVLYYRGDNSMVEVAAALGISEATAKQRVHRGRAQLRESLARVESVLRSTRPSAAFTAGCVALWTARSGKVSAASLAASRSAVASWVPAVTTLAAVAAVALIGIQTGGLTSVAQEPVGALDRRSPAGHVSDGGEPESPRVAMLRELRARFAPQHGGRRAAPSDVVALNEPYVLDETAPDETALDEEQRATAREMPELSYNFKGAPTNTVLHIVAAHMHVPIMVEGEIEPKFDIVVEKVPAPEVFERILALTHARRTEVAALRFVAQGGRDDAAMLGGDLITIHRRDAEVREIINLLEPALGMPIDSGDVDLLRHVSIDVTDASAGTVLALMLQQIGCRYELTTGFLITPASR